MNRYKLFQLLLLLGVINIGRAYSQVKVTDGTTGAPVDGAVLELESANKGLLLPRVSLTDATVWGLNGSTVKTAGMMVYNTNTSTDNGLYGQGMYMWQTTSTGPWAKMPAKSDLSVTAAGISLRKTNVQSYAPGTVQPVLWSSADYIRQQSATPLMWTAGDPSKIVIPANGMYIITATVDIVVTGLGERYIGIHLNNDGSNFNYAARKGVIGGQGIYNSSGLTRLSVTVQHYLQAADVIQVVVANGTSVSLNGSSAAVNTGGSASFRVQQIQTVRAN